MKILHTSDWHLDWMTHGVRRHDELRVAAHEMVKYAVAHDVDLFVFTGDLCNPDSGSCVFECVELAIMVACLLRDRGIPSVWVSGNHDVIEDGRGRTTLAPLAALGLNVHVFETGACRYVSAKRKGIEVLALPYPSATRPYSFDEVFASIPEAEPAHDPLLVLSHLSVPGVQLGEESHEMARGRDVNYPIERVLGLMKKRGGVMLQGHYHRRQSLNFGERWMHIPGSLAQLTFSEEHHRPGFLVIEV